MSEPRQWTEKEIREKFLRQVAGMSEYWAKLQPVDGTPKTVQERLDGLAFSILAMLDGCNIGIPGFIVAPAPHDDDKEYCINEGENWFPQQADLCDIGGGLHELYHKVAGR